MNPSMESNGHSSNMAPPMTSSLKRTFSNSSIASTPSEYNFTDCGTTVIIEHGTTLIENLIAAAQNKQQVKLEKKFKTIRRVFKELEYKEAENQKEIHRLMNHITTLENKLKKHENAEEVLKSDLENMKHSISDRIHQLPTLTDLQDSIRQVITEMSCSQKGDLNPPPPEATPVARDNQERKAATQSHTPKQRSRSPSPGIDRIYKRTLIIKGVRNKTSSKDIQLILTKGQITTANAVEKILHKQFHVEVICKNQDSADRLKREMQKNQTLNRDLTFTTKTAHKEKMILLSVPSQYEESNITHAILNKYKAYRDEIQILASQKSKRDPDKKDWILVLPLDLGRATVRGGVTLGFQYCKIRPHTSIQRCANCQAFGHSYRKCENNRYCVNCGKKHEAGVCNDPIGCVNCFFNNKDEGTNYQTNHKASDSCCEVFRQIYCAERERLDNLFKPPQNMDNPSHPNDQENHPYGHLGGPSPNWGPQWFGPPTELFGHWPPFHPDSGHENIPIANRSSGHFIPGRPTNRNDYYSQQQDLGFQSRRF